MALLNKKQVTNPKAILERQREIFSRPADARYHANPGINKRIDDLLRDLWGPNAVIPDDNRHALINDLFIVLRMHFSDAMDRAPKEVKKLEQDLKMRNPAPTDYELLEFYRKHLGSDYEQVRQEGINKWYYDIKRQNQ